jgi:hypothetical protein
MDGTQDFSNTQAFPPDHIVGNGQTPSPAADTAAAAVLQELSHANFAGQTLLTITGELGPISSAQFMTLSGNACKVYIYCSSAGWVDISFQPDQLPFGVGLQDIRTVLRVIHELWQHRCIEVRFDETAVATPWDLRVKGTRVVLKTERGDLTVNRIYVRCVGFPEHLPEDVRQSLTGKFQRQIDYHQQRVKDLQYEITRLDQRMRRQDANRDTSEDGEDVLAELEPYRAVEAEAAAEDQDQST